MRRLTTEQFIEKSIAIHGDIYDYSKVIYTTNKKKVAIICKEHGVFFKKPNPHLLGEGCMTCVKGIDTKIFIERSKLMHGDKYDYTKTVYVRYAENVIITCIKHNYDLSLNPGNHLRGGGGCQKCAREIVDNCQRMTLGEFVERAISIHGYKFDYSEVIYNNSMEHVTIICKKHGKTSQTPQFHLRSSGCRFCGWSKMSQDRIQSIDFFINGAINVHGDKYSYSKFVYNGCNEISIATCFKHGDFPTSYQSHVVDEVGCPKCRKSSRGEVIINELLASMNVDYLYQYKINIDSGQPKKIDFYINNLNLFIEYNGTQHYEPVQFGNKSIKDAEKAFKTQCERDENLRAYCLINKINLLEIDGRKFYGEPFSIMKIGINKLLSSYIFRLKSKPYFTRNKVD